MKKLKARWGITSDYDLMVIFIVFAVNGSLSGRLGSWLLTLLGWPYDESWNFGEKVLYFVVWSLIILPFYPLLLMVTGWLGGQSKFFWPFAKRILNRISFGLLFAKK